MGYFLRKIKTVREGKEVPTTTELENFQTNECLLRVKVETGSSRQHLLIYFPEDLKEIYREGSIHFDVSNEIMWGDRKY